MYNFKIIEQILICITELIFYMSGEFKVMHFTSSNLLRDFLNGKWKIVFFFFFFFKIKLCEKIRVNLTRNTVDQTHFLTRLKGPILTCNPFDLQPNVPRLFTDKN